MSPGPFGLEALADAVDGLLNRERQLSLRLDSLSSTEGDAQLARDLARALGYVRSALVRRRGELLDSLSSHPAWEWLSRLEGLSPTLPARLLARLALDEAATPALLRLRCGLGMVEGREYRCPRCGEPTTRPASAGSAHTAPRCRCGGVLDVVRDARVAPAVGGAAPTEVDPVARALCRRIAGELIGSGGAYASLLHREMSLLARKHADWPEHRRHLTAMRKVQQRFLLHLWRAWREAKGLPADRHPRSDPWAMV